MGRRSDTRPEIKGQSDTVRNTDCSLFFVSLPEMSGLPKEYLWSEIIDFRLKHQRVMQNILHETV